MHQMSTIELMKLVKERVKQIAKTDSNNYFDEITFHATIAVIKAK